MLLLLPLVIIIYTIFCDKMAKLLQGSGNTYDAPGTNYGLIYALLKFVC